MPALHELQRHFGAALRDGDVAGIAPLIRAAGIEPARRIAVYRNNWRENLLAVLAASYPVLKRLVGDNYFRQMAWEFQGIYPSRSGNLQHFGKLLPEFLEQRFARTEFSYFADIARLEWAYQETLVSAEHGAFDVERLMTVPEESRADLGFILHPAIRLVRSDFPVLTIWSAHQPGAGSMAAAAIEDTTIDLGSGGENIMLRRSDREIEMHRLPSAEFAFLKMLANGLSLATAADEASAIDTQFDLARALQRHVGLAVLVDFSVHVASLHTERE